MKRNKIILLLIFLNFLINVKSQEIINYPNIDKKTYSQYLKADWTGIIETGKIAAKNDIDFYYLQVRMGIAYYELKKYRMAIPYFEKSREVNYQNELVDEYLYYSYLFSGRISDARKFTKTLSINLKNKIGIKVNPIFSTINFDFRTENNDNYKAQTTNGDLLEQIVRNTYSYFSFGAEHYIKNNRKLTWSYSRINIDANVYDIDDAGEQSNDNIKVFQNQFYYSYQNQLDYGLKLTLATNLLNIVIESPVFVPGRPGRPSGYVTGQTSSNEIIGYAGIEKDISNFKIGFNSSISNLNKNFQFQPSVNFVWFPLSNTNLYLSTNADYKFENINSEWQNEPVIKQAVGFRLSKIYFEPSITFGNIINYTESNISIINNDNDKISERFEFLIYGSFVKEKLNLFFKYQNYLKTSIYTLNNTDKEIIYNNQTLTGGIKWNF